jgi:FtsP/CotA-like multicopper oxidase with cupredoxin domain
MSKNDAEIRGAVGETGEKEEKGATRRAFLGQAVAVGAGLALGQLVPDVAQSAEAQPACTSPSVGQPLVEIGAIKKAPGATGPVQGVIQVLNENKMYIASSKAGGGATVCQSGQMRYLQGSIVGNATPVWPPKNGNPAPGPTIRAKVGDTVQITLLNQVDVAAFGQSLDSGEKGDGCDVATTPTTGGGSINTYPGNPPFDNMPDCFHGSSTANLHYHGTHISPNVIEDNVFVQLRPSPRLNGKPVVDAAYLQAKNFNQIFVNCQAGHSPQKWADLPPAWQKAQYDLLTEYDRTAVWQGHRGLPPAEQLWPKDDAAIKAGQWPQYYVGAYPSCFKLPTWNGQPTSMGQAPGTHWYHAHKHGSTALNLANGLAGAFIIEGDYDAQLKKSFNKEVVLVLQQYGSQVNLLRAPGTNTADLVFVNGQYTPVITMQPGEVQLWRIINACHQGAVPINGPTGIKWVQTAQDGVQLNPTNYELGVKAANSTGTWKNATLTTPMTAPPWFGNLAPGNRVDMLVQAPSGGGPYPVTFGNNTLLFTVNVAGNAIPNPIAFPPPQSAFPTMPPFLNDINPGNVVVKRELHFKTSPGAGRQAGTNAPPTQTINGKLFQDHVFDQTMHLGATEEWTLYNDGGPAHPFHIHINPFQIVEILNPAVSATPFKLPAPWIWWDDIAIPPPANGVSGYIKFLTRFVDFTGAYVLHCHILGHEDRGMMEMVQVISNSTTIGHH